MEINNGQLYGSIQAAKKAGISLRQLYHWVDILHVVTPKVHRHGLREFRRFTANDLEILMRVRTFLERGYTLRASTEMVKGERKF